jgi:hypothetical protein
MQGGYVPDKWKTVCPINITAAQKGLKWFFPTSVSNLSFLSKLVEKVVVDQLMIHSSRHAPLPATQSAYRPFHSNETALVKVQSDILMKMDKQEVVLLVMLDLSAAFDTVDTSISLSTLDLNGLSWWFST